MTGIGNVTIDGEGLIEIPVFKVENASSRNITMKGTVYIDNLTGGNVNITALKTPVLHLGKTDVNVEINGSVILGDTLLNGHELTVRGDLTVKGDLTIGNPSTVAFGKVTVEGNLQQTYGTIKLNYGALIVDGNATMANITSDGKYTYLGSNSYLTMDNEADVFTVGGNLITAYYSSGWTKCSAGTMKIGGNWTNYAGTGNGHNFVGSNSFTIVMTGTENVTIDGNNPIDVPALKIENASSRNITMKGTVYTDSLLGGNVTVTAVRIPVLHFGKIDGNLKISGDLTLGLSLKNKSTVAIYGDVFMSSAENLTMSSGSTVNIEGDLIQGGGTVQPAGGSLKVYGDYRIQSGSESDGWTGSSGVLKMTNAQDFVLVGGDFYTQSSKSHSSDLTAGEMIVYGDFYQLSGDSRNFKANGTHKVYLCGDAQQSVQFNSTTSTFNTLQLRYTKDGYIFDPDPCWNNLIEGQELPETYKPTYTVIYNANGGEGGPDPQTKTQKIDLVLSNVVPTKEAYKFLGWAAEANATTAEYLPGSTYSDDKSVTLYAVWDAVCYTVSYDTNGGQGAPKAQTGAYGDKISVSSTIPTPAKEHTVTLYRNDGTNSSAKLTVVDIFINWNTAADGSGMSYNAGDIITLQEDITLYAQWDKAILGDYEYEQRLGYYLYGWFDSPEVGTDGKPMGIRYLPETEITEDIALYGIWKETDTVTLYYGDINRDGIVDFLDISLLNKYRLGKDAPDYDTEEYLLRADADHDRDVDLDDIEIINDLRLNKISQSDVAAAHTGTTVVTPDKTKFAYGEALDTSGLGLAVTFNGNTSYTITHNLTVSGYDPEQAGTQTLTASFYQFAATYSVVVEEKYNPCADGHVEGILPAVNATCSENGLTEGKKCSVCGETLVAQETIPATGVHTYENGRCKDCGVDEPTEPTEPEVTEPEETVPETTVPDETVPETTEPEVTEPEETVPEATEPEETEPEETEPVKPNAPKITGSNVASSGKPRLTWAKVEGAVKYEIWRSTKQNSGFTKIYTQKGTTYTNTKAVAGTKYYYKVKAVDADGNVSDFSNRVGRMCDLARPTNLKTSNVLSSGKIKLTWKAVAGAKSYKVYRSTAKNGKYTLVKTVTGTAYTDANAKAGTKYFYKVIAVHENTNANSAYSVIVSRMADLARPVITVKRNDAGKPRISWKKVEGAVKYEVWRSTSKNGKYTRIATTRNLYQVNKNAVAGKTYYYKVKAIHSNSNANSAFSTIKYIKAK